MKVRCSNLEQTKALAKQVVATFIPGPQATLVGLYGNLGAGKTTFTQSVAEALGVTETVTSPTFIIEKIYKLDHATFDHLIHIDAYRLDREEELVNLGWKEIISNPKNLIFLEWPEKVSGILPTQIQKIVFTVVDETTRDIEVV
ncbi:MAG: tRNA (adenosine(37)-N6)-threonylcarbamoyltransferase complex ATPase subunit type 1 TsaE [Patescibacteria group bacterium]